METPNESSLNLFKKNMRHTRFSVYRYNKDQTAISKYADVKHYRSMIVDSSKEPEVLVCPSPVRSLTPKDFAYHTDQANLMYEEMIDGIMVNLFFDDEENKWQMATRSEVGGKNKFYLDTSAKTFGELFADGCIACDLDLEPSRCPLPQNYQYSFVLEHPEHRIVRPVDSPRLYLVEAYEILDPIEKIIRTININDKSEPIYRELEKIPKLCYPRMYSYKSQTDVARVMKQGKHRYHFAGIMIKDYQNSRRMKVRNPVYEDVKRLRGNHSKKQFLYLTLRQNGNLSTYLRFYPEDGDLFQKYRAQLHEFTDKCYNFYVECFIKKKHHVNNYPDQYKMVMTQLHSMYLKNYVESKGFIAKQDVIGLINKMPPARQMYLLNYELRNFVKDQVVIETQQALDLERQNHTSPVAEDGRPLRIFH
jgi:hypothetical protein